MSLTRGGQQELRAMTVKKGWLGQPSLLVRLEPASSAGDWEAGLV